MYKKLIFVSCLLLYSTYSLARSEILETSQSFGVLSENNKYVYIHLKNEDKSGQILVQGKNGAHINLSRKEFSKEGAYQFKQAKYLWSLEKVLSNYTLIYLMNDGISFIAKESELPEFANNHVFSFYKKGELFKKFVLADFCTDLSILEKSRFRPGLAWYSDEELDNANMIYRFKSCNKGFEIDIATGKVTSKDIPAKPKTGVLYWFKNFFR